MDIRNHQLHMHRGNKMRTSDKTEWENILHDNSRTIKETRKFHRGRGAITRLTNEAGKVIAEYMYSPETGPIYRVSEGVIS